MPARPTHHFNLERFHAREGDGSPLSLVVATPARVVVRIVVRVVVRGVVRGAVIVGGMVT